LRAGEVRRIVYDVTIHRDSTGAGPLPAGLAIRGSVDSAAPAFRAPVSGEDALEVTSCLSIPVALAHMDPNTDIVDLRSSEQITFDQVQRAVTFWIEEVGVPQTCDALVNLDALKELTARQLLNVPVDETLDHISFTNGASPTVTRRILTPLPFYQLYLQARGGDLFRVEIEITADQDYHGFAIGENLPETWALRPLDNNGAAFKHGRVTTGSVGAGASAAVTLTWTTAFADANYTVTCSLAEATASTSTLRLHHLESVAAGSVVARVVNDDGVNPKTGTLHCTAIHD